MIYKVVKKAVPRFKEGQVPFFKNINKACFCLFIFLLVGLLLLPFSVKCETAPKFLIIHLDAISSQNFFQYMEDGYLSNVKAVFESGHIISYGLSLYPGGTETTVPRLKEGLDNSTGGVSLGGYYDRDKERNIPKYKQYINIFSHIPRRAKASFIYGIPGLDVFMFLPLLNIPELLDSYNVIQFYWFTTDALGHFFGEDLYLSSIKRFDRYFGNLVQRLNLDEINLIIYCDHGMSFGQFVDTPQGEQIKRVAGSNYITYIHPNVYLKNPSEKDQVAQDIVLDSEIDFAFYRENPHRVVGYSVQGKMIFEEKEEGKIRYLYEGKDVFNYYTDGYQGDWLTALEWLSLTRESEFPAVPPNIYNFLLNEKAGDIVIVVNPPKIPIFSLPYPANHAGLTKTDLLVPILLRGKELEHLYNREEMWLHNLFTSIPTLSFDNIEPEREINTFSFWGSVKEGEYSGFELSLSPAYRWNVALRYEDEIYKGRFEYDLYSSYVIRLWTGAGLEYQAQYSHFEPFLQARLQMDFGKIQFNYGVQSNMYDLKNWEENRKELVYKINNRLSFNWHMPNRFGLSLHW